MNQMIKFALAAVVGLSLAGCAEDPPAEPEKQEEPAAPTAAAEPAKAEIPAYEPTGDHAEIKKASASAITADNAADQAKALEEELNKEIQALEAAGG